MSDITHPILHQRLHEIRVGPLHQDPDGFGGYPIFILLANATCFELSHDLNRLTPKPFDATLLQSTTRWTFFPTLPLTDILGQRITAILEADFSPLLVLQLENNLLLAASEARTRTTVEPMIFPNANHLRDQLRIIAALSP